MALEEYKRKRHFDKTPEPVGAPGASTPGASTAPEQRHRYLIQKHAARQLHYDFRLELGGVLKSWAVPKGPSLDPADRRLAVHVEDHPLDYGDFEGIIPKGQYGGGTVMLWDQGWWEPEGDPEKDYEKGHLRFILHGEKLHGAWSLVRSRNGWFLIKRRDDAALPGRGTALVETATRSVATGREMEEIAGQADRVWQSGPSPSKINGAVQVPRAPEIPPQLAQLADAAPEGPEWLHEIKFDGYRLLAHIDKGTTGLRSRNGLDWTHRFPVLGAALAKLQVKEALIDGEAVHMGAHGATSFSALQDDLARGDTGAVVFMAFDLLFIDGWDLRGAALEDRKAALARLIAARGDEKIRYSDHQEGKGPAFFAAACRMSLEGIVSKRRDGTYHSGRGGGWLKVKCGMSEERIVVGFTEPGGSRTGFGSLLLGYYTPDRRLVYGGKVGTGFSGRVLADLRARLDEIRQSKPTVALPREVSSRGVHWVRPEIVVEIGFAEWTPDGVLRHPRFLGLREDKSPGEVVFDRPAPAVPAGPEIAHDGSATVAGVRITHADRPLYPARGLTKLAVAEYYAGVADLILPHLVDRPLSLLRCPEGVGAACFFQKHLHAGIPDAVERIEITEKKGPSTYLMVRNVAGLVGLVQIGVLEIHPWGSTAQALEQPDRLIFDLDPDEGLGWDAVVKAAVVIRDKLAALGLQGFPKTTGGKGLHIVVPVEPVLEWDQAKAWTRDFVADLARRSPQLYTASVTKKSRSGKIFIDYLRNGRGATAVAPFSTRAKPGATISVPLTWDEVEGGIRSDHFTIENFAQRQRALKKDPWAGLTALRQRIGP